MTADSQWPLHVAIYDKLRATSAVTSQLSGGADGIHDHVKAGTAKPYVVIGEHTGNDWDSKTEDGMEQTVTLHTFSMQRGDKEAMQIMAAVVDALDRAALSVTGHTLVQLRCEFSQVFLDEDGLTRHGVQRFRALTEAA